MHPLLEIKNLHIKFVQDAIPVPAVQDISFRVTRGSLTALVGESGSGKSVTALSILQLLSKEAITTGAIVFSPDGNKQVNLLALSEKEITNMRGNDIAMIFQEPMTSLNPLFTCGYQVMEVLVQHKKLSKRSAKEKTIDLFRQVQLPDPAAIFDRYPHQLSGGQKQRVMIAMAICCNPSLLIADEPTTALDVTVQKNILGLIKNIQQQTNMSVLLITHDLDLVASIADKVMVMYKGMIVEEGTATAILSNPTHVYTKALLACRPDANAKGKKLSVLTDFIPLPGNTESRTAIKNNIPVVSNNNSLVLSVNNVSVYFPVLKNIFGNPAAFFKAVDDVSFDVMQGETIGLVGESGCGKTTLGRSILQLIKPTSGQIILNGKDLAGIHGKQLREVRKDLQIVFQDPYGSLNPRMTIGDAILEPLNVHKKYNGNKERKEKVIQLLEQVELTADHFTRYPHQFSGGQRQRICIARALALDPSFLIFDEAVSALDISVQATVLNLINELKSVYHFSSIFISHNLSVVHYISDRIIVMNKGKIVEEGTANQVYFNPAVEYTRQLIDALPEKKLLL